MDINIYVSIRLVYICGCTGQLSFTSHSRNVLSVEADASSFVDKNFT